MTPVNDAAPDTVEGAEGQRADNAAQFTTALVAELMTPLETLAAEINEAHAEVAQSARTTLDAALRAGELLERAKGEVPHGKWTKWLGDNFAGSPASARLYMRLHGGRELLETSTVDVLTLNEADRLIAKASKTQPEVEPEDEPADDAPEVSAQDIERIEDVRTVVETVLAKYSPARDSATGDAQKRWRDLLGLLEDAVGNLADFLELAEGEVAR